MRASVEFDSYAPCGFLVVLEGADIHDDDKTILIQTDWDYPSVASAMGWTPCDCGMTDGTIDCEHKTATEMITEAGEYIWEHRGELFEALGGFFA